MRNAHATSTVDVLRCRLLPLFPLISRVTTTCGAAVFLSHCDQRASVGPGKCGKRVSVTGTPAESSQSIGNYSFARSKEAKFNTGTALHEVLAFFGHTLSAERHNVLRGLRSVSATVTTILLELPTYDGRPVH